MTAQLKTACRRVAVALQAVAVSGGIVNWKNCQTLAVVIVKSITYDAGACALLRATAYVPVLLEFAQKLRVTGSAPAEPHPNRVQRMPSIGCAMYMRSPAAGLAWVLVFCTSLHCRKPGGGVPEIEPRTVAAPLALT